MRITQEKYIIAGVARPATLKSGGGGYMKNFLPWNAICDALKLLLPECIVDANPMRASDGAPA
jgi:hypothetical protein